ncbi:MAG: hypothetical protein AABX13_04530 [Nanoarchaeota archaeon]
MSDNMEKINCYWILGLVMIMVILISGCTPTEVPSPEGIPANSLSEDTVEDLHFIVANPVDPSQISRISKFRSCIGHDYSGWNIEGEKETRRSMKHYLEPLPSLIGTDQIRIFAPFDGKVVEMEEGPPGQAIYISAKVTPRWKFIFFHVIPAVGIEEGALVHAGEQLGTASREIHNFDFALKQFGWSGQVFDSPFRHMKNDILEEYVQQGVTLENIILLKPARDAEPCPVSGTKNGDALFVGYKDEDFVMLRHGPALEVETDAIETDTMEPTVNSASPGAHQESASLVEENAPALFPGGTVIQQQEGVTFEHYFPNTGSLKSDESEILIYNQGKAAVQITSSDMKFILDGKRYEQYSGTWEKFPRQQSWERMEYVNIHPRYYAQEPLILQPGQKGKLHWHYQFGQDIQNKPQAVEIDIIYTLGGKKQVINQRLTKVIS